MPRLEVAHQTGMRFRAEIRGHRVTFDQPVGAGGDDLGPTPTEMFVASLAACVAFYVERFLTRHGAATAGLHLAASFQMTAHPARVGSVDIEIGVPPGLPESLRAPLLAVAEHCTVHNSILVPPQVTIGLARESAAATR